MTGGSDLEQFMNQPFVGPAFAMTCFLGILLVLMIVILVILRQRRSQKARAQTVAGVGYVTAAEHDMPDLNLLVSTPVVEGVQMPSFAQPAAPPPPVRQARKGTFSVTVQDGQAAEAVEVMTVLRDVVDGRLIVQMGDRAYENINNNAELRERFSRVMRELIQIASGAAAVLPSAPSEAAAPETEPGMELSEPLPDAAPPPAPEAPPPPRARSAAPPPPPLPSGQMPGDLPSFKLADNPMVKAKGRKLDLKPVPEINIAGAVEAYLQYKLQHAPEYAGRSIHIYPAPDGGVSIEVDGQYYEAVSDVADGNVREFISQAIQEWQERH